MSTTRFDLEQSLMRCWSTADDVDLLLKEYLDGPKPMTEDEMANALLGIKTLHHMRCKEAFNIFEQLTQRGELDGQRNY